jgi:hypothetical protein
VGRVVRSLVVVSPDTADKPIKRQRFPFVLIGLAISMAMLGVLSKFVLQQEKGYPPSTLTELRPSGNSNAALLPPPGERPATLLPDMAILAAAAQIQAPPITAVGDPPPPFADHHAEQSPTKVNNGAATKAGSFPDLSSLASGLPGHGADSVEAPPPPALCRRKLKIAIRGDSYPPAAGDAISTWQGGWQKAVKTCLAQLSLRAAIKHELILSRAGTLKVVSPFLQAENLEFCLYKVPLRPVPLEVQIQPVMDAASCRSAP